MEETQLRRQKMLICALAVAVILLLGIVIILFIRGRVEKNIIVEQPPASPAPAATNTPPPASPPTENTSYASYFSSYPYPVTWTEGGDEFDLVGVTLGHMAVTPDMVNGSMGGQPYPSGTKIYALTLVLKISTGNSQMCLPVNMRVVISEAGDLGLPDTTSYDFPDVRGPQVKGYCPAPNSTFYNQKVVFRASQMMPPTTMQFLLTTGGSSNVFFFVTPQSDGTIKVEKAPTSENG
jgi:hypothetical protein